MAPNVPPDRLHRNIDRLIILCEAHQRFERALADALKGIEPRQCGRRHIVGRLGENRADRATNLVALEPVEADLAQVDLEAFQQRGNAVHADRRSGSNHALIDIGYDQRCLPRHAVIECVGQFIRIDRGSRRDPEQLLLLGDLEQRIVRALNTACQDIAERSGVEFDTLVH